MVLKRKLPTQVAEEKESKDNKSEDKDTQKTSKSDEPWVFSGGDSSKEAKVEPKSGSKEKPKAEEKKDTTPAPWSVESLEGNKKDSEKSVAKEPAAPVSTGDYPWAVNPSKDANDSWKITDEKVEAISGDGAKPPLAPTNDVYAGVAGDAKDSAKSGTPPWQGAGGGSESTPPILPDATEYKKGGMVKSLVMLVVVAAVLVGGYMALFKKRDKVAEVTARWTGTLNKISQKIESSSEDEPQPEDTFSFNLGSSKKDKKENEKKIVEKETEKKDIAKAEEKKEVASKNPNTKVDFVDVEKDESKEPIVADEATKMPEDLSLFATLQAAIMKEKEVKRTADMAQVNEDDIDIDPEVLSPEEKVAIGQKLRKQTNQQMEDYIKTLVKIKNPSLKPKPGQFFDNPKKYKEKADNYRLQGASPKSEDFNYKSNPNNLPVIPEPTVPTKPGVRTLADFGEQIFEVPRNKVRMPRSLAPRMGAAGFPSLEILSLVPHKGIIAFAGGREGILMIGEEIEGWELTSVRNEYAEFHNGKRKHIVSIDVIR